MAIATGKKLSARLFSLLTLILFALMSVGMILYATYSMYQIALNAQFTSMERVVEVAVNEQLRQMNLKVMTLGQTISQRKEFRQAYKDYLTTGKKSLLQHQLNDPLLNGHNFAASLELLWLRSYDLQFQLVSKSSTDTPIKIQTLAEDVRNSLARRQGVERMQAYGVLWQDNKNNPYYSMIIPIGGLRLQGYLEVVINPLFNLPGVENMIKMPISINSLSGITLFQSKQAIDNERFMPVSYWLKDIHNKLIIEVKAYADIALLESQTDRTTLQSVIAILILTAAVLLLAIWLLNHYFFQPLNRLISKLDEYENDDTITIPNNGLLELHILANAFNRLLIRLHERNQELTRLSVLDGLTGIANRRRFDEYLQQQWLRARQSKEPLSLLLIDIDHFKLYNDHYGHQQGDFCLRQVASTIEQALDKDDDMVARYGGEEFAVILPHTQKADAYKVAERIMDKLNQRQLIHGKSPTYPCVTVSTGISSCFPSQVNINEACLIACTDNALYQAKEEGRNRYFVSEGCKKFDLNFQPLTSKV